MQASVPPGSSNTKAPFLLLLLQQQALSWESGEFGGIFLPPNRLNVSIRSPAETCSCVPTAMQFSPIGRVDCGPNPFMAGTPFLNFSVPYWTTVSHRLFCLSHFVLFLAGNMSMSMLAGHSRPYHVGLSPFSSSPSGELSWTAERLGSASLKMIFFYPLSKKERLGDTLYFCVARSPREEPGDAGEIQNDRQTADERTTSLHVRVCTLVFSV